MKGSGFGREKGFEALYGFSALKTVAIHHGEWGGKKVTARLTWTMHPLRAILRSSRSTTICDAERQMISAPQEQDRREGGMEPPLQDAARTAAAGAQVAA
jgi:hypothetical protein